MITVSHLQPASEMGTCNACSRQIGEHGTIPGSQVHVVDFIKGSAGTSFRLCPSCARELYNKLASKLRD
jgi:hypothetical protein